MDNYIKCECMTKRLKGNIVLDNISLSVKRRIFSFEGHNGSGKTMILRAISGLMHLNSGVVYIDNEIIGKQKQFPDSMGILIEYPSFIPGYTGFQNLKFYHRLTIKSPMRRFIILFKGLDLIKQIRESIKDTL